MSKNRVIVEGILTPAGRDGHYKIRHEKVDETGRVTLRHASGLHHIGIGYEHIDTAVRMLIHDLQLDTSRDYQPLGRPPGPPKGRPHQGGRKRQT